MRRSLALAFVLVLAGIGCGGSPSPAVDAPITPIDAPAIDAAVIDAQEIDAREIDAQVDAFAPAVHNLTGGANGLHWDGATSTLYLTDSNANALLRYTDATGVQAAPVGTFPAVTGGASLGDVVQRADGSFLTPNFGFGTQGTIFHMTAAGTSSALTGLAVNRRRIGLSQDSAGVLYVAYFVGGGAGTPTGGVASVAITGGAAVETEIAGASTGATLKKLVGVVATPTALFVADQTDRIIYRIAIPGGAVTTVATVPTADLLMMMPNGDLLTGGSGTGAGVHRITQAGAVTTIMTGLEQIRGMAFDPVLHRLFIIEHSATVGTPDRLHIRPLAN